MSRFFMMMCLACPAVGFPTPASSTPLPVGCQCDFSNGCAVQDNIQKTTNYYLCKNDTQFQKCRADIEKSEPKPPCECLAMGSCKSTMALLMLNKNKECKDACSAPKPLDDICPNYDDEQLWCSYYAIQQCVEHTAACDFKYPMSSLESKCDAQAQKSSQDSDDQLDKFLLCMGSAGVVVV